MGLAITEARVFIRTENHIPHALGLGCLASPVILALGRLPQEDCHELGKKRGQHGEFCRVRQCCKAKKETNRGDDGYIRVFFCSHAPKL